MKKSLLSLLPTLLVIKVLSVGHALEPLEDFKVNGIINSLSNKPQGSPAGVTVALVEPLGDGGLKRMNVRYGAVFPHSGRLKSICKFGWRGAWFGNHWFTQQHDRRWKAAMMCLLRKQSKVFLSKNRPLGYNDLVSLVLEISNSAPINVRPDPTSVDNRKLIKTWTPSWQRTSFASV